MNLCKYINKAVNEVFQEQGLSPLFQGEVDEAQMISASQVNVLIGLSGEIKGSIVFGFRKSDVLGIVMALKGGKVINDDGGEYENTIARLASAIVENTIKKIEEAPDIKFSSPTMVTGDRMFLIISRIKSNKLTFKLDDKMFNIAYSLEK